MKTPVIYDTISNGDREERVVNQEATLAAREKQKLIKERFRSWIFSDPERTERLVRLYNDTYNNLRPRLFDGSHLDFPGMNQTLRLRPHQCDAVWRGMSAGNTLLAHAVGAGKTFTMAATGMKMKQAGLSQKPIYVVPNHLLEQFAREFMQLYPNAKLLVAAKEDLTRERRKFLTAKIASGAWDGIIMTHSSFERIGLSRAYQEQFLREQIQEYDQLLTDGARADSSRGHRNLIKTIEKQKAKRQERLKDLLAEDKKDDGLVFDELGVDHIFIDEAHYFKNLETPTKMERVAGIQTGGSERAFDIYMKARYLGQRHAGHGVTFATGTPISNTMAAEVFLVSGVTLTNAAAATLVLYEAAPLGGASGETLVNNGMFLTQGPSIVAVPFINGPTGTVHVLAGTQLTFGDGTSSGAFIGDPGTSLAFGTFVFAAATPDTPNSSITADNVAFASPDQVVPCPYTVHGSTYLDSYRTVRFTGPVAVAGSDLDTSVNTNGTFNFTTFDFTAAQLQEPLTFRNVYGHASILSAADVHITGTYQQPPGGYAMFGGGGTMYFDGGTAAAPNFNGASLTLDSPLVNNGYTSMAAEVFLVSGVTLTNAAAATLVLYEAAPLGGASGETLVNNGMFLTQGPSIVAVPFINAGTVDVASGTLQFIAAVSNPYVQTAGSTILGGGNLAGQIDIEGGVLKGTGTIFGSVRNAGQVNPGFSPGTITISGDYTQTDSGHFLAEIGGLSGSSQYDQIGVSGNVNLAGALNLVLINGFTPQLGNQFILIDNRGSNPIDGALASLPEGATVWDTTHTYSFTISYIGGDGNDVVLTAKQTTATTTTAVTASVNPSVYGQAVTFTATVTNTSSSATPSGSVEFFDGATDLGPGSALSGSGGSATSTFMTSSLALGGHSITAIYTPTANFLGSTSPALARSVVNVAVQTDPCDPTLTALVVGGTPGNDTIVFSPVGNGGDIQVTLNSVSLGIFHPTGRLIAYGGAGDDDIQVAGSITLPAWLFGGDGNDRLKGGNGDNVLEGGAGDDLLVGGGGRDLLIGGGGADRLIGNGGDDILIGGTTAYDTDLAALGAIMDEWTSAHDYATRVANLNNTGTGLGFLSRLNGDYFLVQDQTVFNDASQDTLTGSAGTDWFFAGTADRLTDLSDLDRAFIFS